MHVWSTVPPVTPSYRVAFLAVFAVAVAFFPATLRAQDIGSSAVRQLRFVENRGQIVDTRHQPRPDILYTATSGPVTVYVRRSGLSYVFARTEERELSELGFSQLASLPHSTANDPFHHTVRTVVGLYRMDVDLVGANPRALVTAEDVQVERSNYYTGSHPKGITQVASVQTLTIQDVYPKIDLVYRANGTDMKYDFVVHPGGRVSDIAIRYVGADAIEQLAHGGLRVRNEFGEVLEGSPVTFQTTPDVSATNDLGTDRRHEVASSYCVDGSTIRFQVAPYDSSRPLVVDPYLAWSTYFGGGDWEGIYPFGGGAVSGEIVAADGRGNYIVAGTTRSLDFPITPGAFQPGNEGFFDGFLVCLSSNGTRLWSTYFGGNNWDLAGTLSIDSLGYIALTGITNSTDLPVTPGCFQSQLNGSTYDLFIATFDSMGQRIWATYYGGTGMEHNGGCHVDQSGALVVGGTTWSTDLPVTPGAMQSRLRGDGDAFLARFGSAGNRLWCTMVGGGGSDWGSEVVADNEGHIYLTGGTNSADFPVTPKADQPLFGSPLPNLDYDAFLVQFDIYGRRTWGTYFGGSSYDWGYGVGVDCRGNVILGGTTKSSNLPTTAKAAQKTIAGATRNDGFVARYDSKGTRIWSTYYGGRMIDYGSGVSAAPNGHAYLVGYTTSDDLLKSTNNYQTTLHGSGDLYLVEFDSDGMVVWDSYYGGSGVETGSGIAGDGAGGIVVAGFTTSTDLPIVNGYQPTLNASGGDPTGFYDFFIARLCNTLGTRPIPDGPVVFCEGDSVVLSAPGGFRRYRWSPGNEIASSIIVRSSGVYSFTIEDSLGCAGSSDTISVLVKAAPKPMVERTGDPWICAGDSVVLRAISPGAKGFLWSNGMTTPNIVVRSAGVYSVRATDSIGCSGVSVAESIAVLPRPPQPTISGRDTIWICADSMVTFRAGGGYSYYHWSNGDTTESIQVGLGTYWVEVGTSQSVCSNRSKKVVVALAPVLSRTILPLGSTVICAGDSVVLDAGEGMVEYLWTSGESSRTIRVGAAGNYGVWLLDSNGCAAVAPAVAVTVRPRPLAVVQAAGATSFCDGDSVVLDGGSGHASYLWTTGETTQRIVVRTPGNYAVEVADAPGGCLGQSKGINVIVNPLPTPTITLSGPTTIRAGESLTLEGPVGFAKYYWSTGDSSRSIIVRSSGSYSLLVVSDSGCSALSAAVDVVVVPSPTVRVRLPRLLSEAGEDVVIPVVVEGDNLAVNGITTLTAELRFDASLLLPIGYTDAGWIDGNERIIPISLSLVDAETGGGTVGNMAFVALLGDSDHTVLRLENIVWPPGTRVISTVESGEFRLDRNCTIGGPRRVNGTGNLFLRPVRPNPASGNVEIEFSVVESGSTELVIIDILGQPVARLHTGDIEPGGYTVNVDLGDCPAGLYRLVLTTPTDRLSQPLRVVE